VADQLWLMTRIREEELKRTNIFFQAFYYSICWENSQQRLYCCIKLIKFLKQGLRVLTEDFRSAGAMRLVGYTFVLHNRCQY